MTGSLNNALMFLISTLFDMYLFILCVRLILAWSRANYFNPITQFIIKITQPLVGPLRRVIPNVLGIEFSTLLLIFMLEMVKYSLLSLVVMGMPDVLTLLALGAAYTIKLILTTFFYAILFQALLSWFQPSYSPMSQLLAQMTSPILRPIQRIIPPISGFDISPIPALIILQLLIILV